MTVISPYLLIDASCSLVGYVEDMRGNLAADGEKIAAQCHRFGVGAVRDTGSGIAAKSRFASAKQNVEVVGGTIAITDCAPMTRSEIVVRSSSQLDNAVSLCRTLGERWICARSNHPDFFHAIRVAAAPFGISVCGKGAGVFDAVRVGDVRIVDGVASLLPTQTSPIEALSSAVVTSDAMWSDRTDALVEKGACVCTGLLSLRRAVFLKEAIQAPYLEDLAAIVPHSQYLHRMRQGSGYLAGKRALETHSGMREPTRKERHTLDEGWARITEWVLTATLAGVTFFASIKSPPTCSPPWIRHARRACAFGSYWYSSDRRDHHGDDGNCTQLRIRSYSR